MLKSVFIWQYNQNSHWFSAEINKSVPWNVGLLFDVDVNDPKSSCWYKLLVKNKIPFLHECAEIHPIPLFGTCVTISGVADGATLTECTINCPHKYSVRKSACTHINVHTFKCAREHRCYRGAGIQTVNDSDTQSCWKDSQNQKNKSTITATGRNTQCVCVYLCVWPCVSADSVRECVCNSAFTTQTLLHSLALSNSLSPSNQTLKA